MTRRTSHQKQGYSTEDLYRSLVKPQLETIPETGHWKTGGSAEKS